jgi:hypothetical protein
MTIDGYCAGQSGFFGKNPPLMARREHPALHPSDGRHEKVDFGSAMMRKAAMLDLMQPHWPQEGSLSVLVVSLARMDRGKIKLMLRLRPPRSPADRLES